jgi:hypothetical protein
MAVKTEAIPTANHAADDIYVHVVGLVGRPFDTVVPHNETKLESAASVI